MFAEPSLDLPDGMSGLAALMAATLDPAIIDEAKGLGGIGTIIWNFVVAVAEIAQKLCQAMLDIFRFCFVLYHLCTG